MSDLRRLVAIGGAVFVLTMASTAALHPASAAQLRVTAAPLQLWDVTGPPGLLHHGGPHEPPDAPDSVSSEVPTVSSLLPLTILEATPTAEPVAEAEAQPPSMAQ